MLALRLYTMERTSYYPNGTHYTIFFLGNLISVFFLTLLLMVWHLTWCIYLYVYIFRSRQPVCVVIGFDVLRKGLPYVYKWFLRFIIIIFAVLLLLSGVSVKLMWIWHWCWYGFLQVVFWYHCPHDYLHCFHMAYSAGNELCFNIVSSSINKSKA